MGEEEVVTDRDGYAGSHALLDAFQLPRVTRDGAVQQMVQLHNIMGAITVVFDDSRAH